MYLSYLFAFIYLFIWLHQVLVAACGIYLAADMLPRRCNSVRNSFLHNTTDHIIHTHPAMSRSYCLESRKEFYWERRAFLYTERKKAAIAYLGTQLGRDPVSCQHQCG